MVGLMILCMLIIEGCGGTRTVYLGRDTTKTVQLRETVRNAKIWVLDSLGVAHPAIGDLPEGGFYRSNLAK